jgi:TonB-dependent siderophore receptor
MLEGTRYGTTSDERGNYVIKNVAAGNYRLVVATIGYHSHSKNITVNSNEILIADIRLEESIQETEQVTITATGIKEEIKDVPGTINVIDQKQIQESGAQSVGQIITRVPGVNYLDEDGRGLKPNIGLRGLDPQRNRNLLVLIDGKFPIGMTLYGDPAAYYMIPVEQVERIEVIKGASPVLYGGYSVGGVINMMTKSGKFKPETKIGIGYGSYNALTTSVSTGANNGKFSYYFSGMRRQGDGYRDRSKFGINDYSIKLGSQLDSTSEISIYLNAFTEDSETPGGITQTQFEENPRQSNHKNDHFYAKRFSSAISYKKSFNKFHAISASVYGNYFVRDWWIAYKAPKNNGFIRDIHAIGTIVDYNLSKDVFKKKNSLIVGVRVHSDRLDDINIAGDTATSRTGTTTGNKINTSFIYEGFIYDEFSILRNLTFSPGIRYTSVKYHRNDFVAKRIDELHSSAFIYSAGLIYKLNEQSRIYATVSKGYQPPALNSALAPNTINAGVDLKPETSMNYELGLRLRPYHLLSVNLAAYQMFFDNKVITEGGINKNNGSSFHRGVEMEFEVGPCEGVSFFANGAIQKATFSNGEYNGKILPYAPQQVAAAGLRYKMYFDNSSLTFNVYDNYVGKQYNDAKNTEEAPADGTNGAIPAYNVLNATINYNRNNWGVYLNAFNLLDRNYFTVRYAASSWNGLVPSPGRNFMAGVNFKF